MVWDAALWEDSLISRYGTDGLNDAYFVCNNRTASGEWPSEIEGCDRAELNRLLPFWCLDIPMVLVCIIVELLLLGLVAVRTACQIAGEYEYRLVPLNAERAFVAHALIR